MTSLKFWQDCLERRKTQLILHRQSKNALLKRIERPEPGCGDEEFEKWSRELSILHEQDEWIKEAEKKLEHAENMVRMLGGR